MSTLAPLMEEFYRGLEDNRPSGLAETGVPNATFFWSKNPAPLSPLLYDSGIVIVGQGQKVGYLGGRRFQYDEDSCLVLGVPVPFECEVHVSEGKPLLGLRIDVDLTMLHSLVARFRGQLSFEEGEDTAQHTGVEPVRMEGPLLDATARLLESLRDPMDRQVTGPAAIEEIVYRILRGDRGQVLYALTQHHTSYSHVARALERMHRDYRDSLTVEELAKETAMSVSAFHRAFKHVTGDSPLQYLKKLRLLKAKGLLVFEGMRVEQAAQDVGYQSPSQFSREFKRYFRVPPSEAVSLPYSDRVRAI